MSARAQSAPYFKPLENGRCGVILVAYMLPVLPLGVPVLTGISGWMFGCWVDRLLWFKEENNLPT
jgi:hypothetical protein